MSSRLAVPSVGDFLTAASDAIGGTYGPRVSARRGGTLDLAMGPTAVLWAQEAARDRDNFRQVYAESATGPALDRIVKRRYGIDRIYDTYGTGSCLLQRPTAGGGADTIYAGSRVEVLLPGRLPAAYAVTSDVPVGPSDLIVTLPIRATRTGQGVAVQASTGNIRLADIVFDATFAPVSLVCGDGTDLESDADYLARGRTERRDQRVGYPKAIRDACYGAGAANVVILDAGVFGDAADFGVTHLYVSDQGFASPDSLLDACAMAADAARVDGCDMFVLGMEVTPVTLDVAVTLWDSPGSFNLLGLRTAITAALLEDFNRRPDFWVFSADSLAAAVIGADPDAVQSVAITSSPSPPTPAFVPVLPRYTLRGTDCTISFAGPS